MLVPFLSLMGGLAIFIYAMQSMGDDLQNATGKKMMRVLDLLTGIPIIGVLLGALMTMVVQSSSFTTVMVVGFVNASLINLKQAVAVIMGANIGTTITAQLVAFKITEYWYLIAAFGFILYFFFKKKKVKNSGHILFSLGLLLLGMVLMGDAMKPLSNDPMFTSLMLELSSNTFLALLAGLLFTVLVQSSSASTGVVIAMASQGLISLDAALPILLGTNIGTCITSVLASIGTGLNAKRAAAAHVLFNVIGSIIFLAILPLFEMAVLAISPEGDIPRQIANAHTLFNIAVTIICLPFINLFVKAVIKIIPGTEEVMVTGPLYLDWNSVNNPDFALDLTQKEVLRMSDLAADNLQLAVDGFLLKKEKKLKKMKEQEKIVNDLETEISRYLSKVAQSKLSEKAAVRLNGMLHAINDIERVSDHADNIADRALASLDEELPFSNDAIEEIKEMYKITMACYDLAKKSLAESSQELIDQVYLYEVQIDKMERQLRKSHIKRLNEQACNAKSGVIFLDIISNFERVGDHSTNLVNLAQENF